MSRTAPTPSTRTRLAGHARLAAALAAAALAAACSSDGGTVDLGTGGGTTSPETPLPNPPGVSMPALPEVLTRYFVQNFDAYAAAARRLIDYDRRYTVQDTRDLTRYRDFTWASGNPIENAGVHYAHAAGLTGAGQSIAISDTGFLTTHETLAGRDITLGTNPGVDGHGTQVASVAAGNSASMVGVAPGASLILGNFGDVERLAEVAELARLNGSVALNNSWTFVGLTASASDYSYVFDNTAGRAYAAALSDYVAGGGVAVWAAPNDQSATDVGLMAALPVLRPDLEPGWIAVVNGLPTLSDDDVVSATLHSAGCMEAADWCVAADGTWYGASASSNTGYQVATGSSFATPMVSGALALLGEAFPDLTPQQLRVRLLASADNSFKGFTRSGSVELAAGFSHDVSDDWGHGFLDVAAALMPIGQTTLATASGAAYPTSQPLAVETPATGDAVARALSDVELLGRDALGAGFTVEAPSLVAARAPAPLHASDVSDLAAGYSPAGHRAAFLTGVAAQARANDGALFEATLPRGGGAESYGLAASRELPTSFGALSLSAGAGYDGGALLPTLFGEAGAPLAFAGLGASFDLGEGLALKVSTSGAAAGGATLDAASLEFSARDPFGLGGALTLGLALPPAVTSGAATLTLPVRAASGAEELRDFELGLAPAARELRHSISYALPLARGVDGLVSLEFARDRGNVAGRSEASALIGLVARF